MQPACQCSVVRTLAYMQVLPLYWPYDESLQSAVLQSLQSAEHGLGRDAFRAHNLRVRCDTESDGHITVSVQTLIAFAECRLQGRHADALPLAVFVQGITHINCLCRMHAASLHDYHSDASPLVVSVQGITEVGILEFKPVEGPAELKIARYCMSKMREMRDGSSELYLRSFMPLATCEVVGSELR